VARPRKEGMDYFPHDTDATSDEKIDAMRALYGNDGYAFYFILCERIYRTSEAELDVSKPVLLTPVVKKLMLTQERFHEMLQAAFDLELLSEQDYRERGVITSIGIKKRFNEVHRIRKNWRDSKEKEVFQQENHVENDVENLLENPEETPESKEKKIESKANKKEKESKKKYAEYVSMTEAQYQKLVDQYGPDLANEMVSVLDNYKGSKGKTYKDDYRAILSWVVEKVLSKYRPKGGTSHEKFTGSAPGQGHGGLDTADQSSSITGGQTGWIGRGKRRRGDEEGDPL
jgi:hypothetical protein